MSCGVGEGMVVVCGLVSCQMCCCFQGPFDICVFEEVGDFSDMR